MAWELRWTRTLKASFVDIKRMPIGLLFDLERLQQASKQKAWIEEVL